MPKCTDIKIGNTDLIPILEEDGHLVVFETKTATLDVIPSPRYRAGQFVCRTDKQGEIDLPFIQIFYPIWRGDGWYYSIQFRDTDGSFGGTASPYAEDSFAPLQDYRLILAAERIRIDDRTEELHKETTSLKEQYEHVQYAESLRNV